MIKLSPSLLAADMGHLSDEIARAEAAGADMIHIDVMDGVFVPNISFGFPVIEAARRATKLPLDVHVMVARPADYIGRIVEAGADIVTVHVEAFNSEDAVSAAVDAIRDAGASASLTVCPATPVDAVMPYLPRLSMVLIMTVEPGYGGQPLIIGTLDKVRALRAVYDGDIEVDGGINPQTAPLVKEAGANVLVAGKAFYMAPDLKAAADYFKR